jgi:hypothetical protein
VRRAVYASATKSLALEILVHLDRRRAPPHAWSHQLPLARRRLAALRVPDDRLPRQWRTSRGVPATQRIGDEWLATTCIAGLGRPERHVPGRVNDLPNPAHLVSAPAISAGGLTVPAQTRASGADDSEGAVRFSIAGLKPIPTTSGKAENPAASPTRTRLRQREY